jgi:hypothetical protein
MSPVRSFASRKRKQAHVDEGGDEGDEEGGEESGEVLGEEDEEEGGEESEESSEEGAEAQGSEHEDGMQVECSKPPPSLAARCSLLAARRSLKTQSTLATRLAGRHRGGAAECNAACSRARQRG